MSGNTIRPQQPRGSRLIMLFSDNLSNIYSIYDYNGIYIMIYDPMTPVRSCSGKYSGGTPFLKEISEDDYQELKIEFENLAKRKENHTFDRTRPTGLFTSRNDKFIVRYGYYDEFQTILKKHHEIDSSSDEQEISEMVEYLN